jgi:outer membrane lipoprotein-sorting protein
MLEKGVMKLGRRAFLVASAFAVPALGDDGFDAILADIRKARAGTKSLVATFTQERKLSLLATSVKSAGRLAYVAPDRLRWELSPPDDIVYFIGPEGLSYRSKSSKATASPQGAQVARALADLRAILTGDLGQLRPRYDLTATRTGDETTIGGTAKDKAATVRAFTLVIGKDLVAPVRTQLVEGKADTIDLVFANAQLNVPVDPATMRP